MKIRFRRALSLVCALSLLLTCAPFAALSEEAALGGDPSPELFDQRPIFPDDEENSGDSESGSVNSSAEGMVVIDKSESQKVEVVPEPEETAEEEEFWEEVISPAEGSITMNYAGCTNEELVKIITAGDDAAYETLFRNLRPIILHEAEIYRGQISCWV